MSGEGGEHSAGREFTAARDAPETREYPESPRVGVAAVVLEGDQVLLIRRGREPLKGAWSLPGGLLELGETLSDGIAREVREETGLAVRPLEIVATLDRIVHDGTGRVQYHYVLVEWLCSLQDGLRQELCCGDDAADVRWVRRNELSTEGMYRLSAEVSGVIDRALERMERRRG